MSDPMTAMVHPDILSLLDGMRLCDDGITWPADAYHVWLDRLSHVATDQAAPLADAIVALAYCMQRQFPTGASEVMTKLYTGATLLQQRAGVAHEGEQDAPPLCEEPGADRADLDIRAVLTEQAAGRRDTGSNDHPLHDLRGLADEVEE